MSAQAPTASVRTLFFDVFGTLMEWRTSVAREAERILAPLGHNLDWLAFAVAWRAEYHPIMDEVREALADLNLAWHRLEAWPEVSAAMARLKKKFWIAPCSNGNISLGVDLARRNNLSWDAILGFDVAHNYKPDPVVYLTACDAFSLAPAQFMMVAAHGRDLAAAAKCNLSTAHIARIDEYGPNTGEAAPTVPVDIAGKDLADVADQLGV